jgi:hypothetical protein
LLDGMKRNRREQTGPHAHARYRVRCQHLMRVGMRMQKLLCGEGALLWCECRSSGSGVLLELLLVHVLREKAALRGRCDGDSGQWRVRKRRMWWHGASIGLYHLHLLCLLSDGLCLLSWDEGQRAGRWCLRDEGARGHC